uniref:ZP domain-containing protein n=1 Tax=Caenorhabditis tropicalis TaxID=1561998 RepID=A0A1I7UUV6_9PELO
MNFSILLLVSLAVSVSSITNFDFSGTVKCEALGRWCFTIRAIEVDPISNDGLVKYEKCSVGDKLVKYAMVATPEDNDGLLDNTFEIALEVRHNCSTSSEKTITTDYVNVPMDRAAYSMAMNFDLNTNTALPQ